MSAGPRTLYLTSITGLVIGAGQCDSDGDGYGNACDADLNNNGVANAEDSTLFRQLLGQPPGPSGLVP